MKRLAPVLDRVNVYGAIITGAILLCAAGYGLVESAQPVQAKASEPVPCVEVAVVGTIHTWQCEDADGEPFLQNSMGFMTR